MAASVFIILDDRDQNPETAGDPYLAFSTREGATAYIDTFAEEDDDSWTSAVRGDFRILELPLDPALRR